ncbi:MULTISPECIES: NAD-dependent epimerase/dehydratase family protein [unclassified Methylobacterium]|uniref:NAD-dependent epimerase/dehydratase family protein n=1 Tax=unclassified Methylobacterium TaxID=2615210 RepID=UPI0006FC7544|nr:MULTISPECIES: NAD-dependent epimerase/dehydratase family protein [unclassified Methylobacterium]KQO49238.1 NAD-dependent dehydratase [Methylobacterium sp. Leaf86]KQP00537.1 NAD-dependent dehydratase [Methylobacterium sp. Leaf91]MBO1020883.1 NAD-dependent epimerase/dehydratase family protein [Methylobacterium sp. SD274]
MKKILVTGAGGFIGHHLVKSLVNKGYWVRGADIKLPQYEASAAHDFMQVDLRMRDNCAIAVKDMDEVYHLAADMGGIGFISGSHAEITLNNTLISAHMIEAARYSGLEKFLFSSSACVYPQHLQLSPDVTPLSEDVAWPAQPEEGYGLEKIYMEKMCQYMTEDWKIPTRSVRFHNVYGPLGTYDGGREKAPAAISRKVVLCPDGGEIEVWGDGLQTRSFMYIDDCVEGLYRLMHSDYCAPINLGTDEMISINDLVDIAAEIAGKTITKRHDLTKPQGVRGRNSDNGLIRKVLDWEPKIMIREGLVPTYRWIEEEIAQAQPVLHSVAAE